MASRRSNKKKKKTGTKKAAGANRQLLTVLLLFGAVFIFAGLVFTEQTGFMGHLVDLSLRTILGNAALLLPVWLVLVAVLYLLYGATDGFRNRIWGAALAFFLLVVLVHLRLSLQLIQSFPETWSYMEIISLGLHQQGGGLLGGLLAASFYFLFRNLGSYIVIAGLGVISLLLLFDISLPELGAGLKRVFKSFCDSMLSLLRGLSRPGKRAKTPFFESGEYRVNDFHDLESVFPEEETADGAPILPEDTATAAASPVPPLKRNGQPGRRKEGGTDDENEKGLEEEPASLVHIIENNKPNEEYSVPPVDLLTKVNRLRDYQQQQKVIQDRARALEHTFNSFGVKAKIKEIQSGPAVTRFEVQPETGVKVSKILSLSDDLALNLAASDVRIEAPIPGKAAIGIEVPNKIVSLIYLREVLDDSFFKDSPSPLTLGLGKDITGVPIFGDLLKMPHLLIAGSTGSGKSVCINSIICSILLKASPWEVKFLLVDPKVVELNIYNGIPHLISPVITEPKRASVALRSMVKEMERRYELFAHEGARDIGKYNEQLKNSQDGIETLLPYIVVVIDELADLMMVAPSEVEDSIVRLSQMSRAAGIHLVIATQRPSVDVITGLIKANITSRIAFAVSSHTDSRTILDAGGAEKLLGRGDMLYHPIGAHKPFRVQGAFISERDIYKVVEYIKQQESPVYQQSFVVEQLEGEPGQQEQRYDPLLPEVIELIYQAGQASISLIQRRFRVGYTRAARLIDELERLGIIGKFEGSKPRQISMKKDEAMSLLAGEREEDT